MNKENKIISNCNPQKQRIEDSNRGAGIYNIPDMYRMDFPKKNTNNTLLGFGKSNLFGVRM